MLVSVYLGINKKEVSILNEEIKGDKRYEYEVEESIPNKQYMVRRTSSGTFRIRTVRLKISCQTPFKNTFLHVLNCSDAPLTA
jgi:hypothetical protein